MDAKSDFQYAIAFFGHYGVMSAVTARIAAKAGDFVVTSCENLSRHLPDHRAQIGSQAGDFDFGVCAFVFQADVALVAGIAEYGEQTVPIGRLLLSIRSGNMALQMDTGHIWQQDLQLL